MLVGGVRPLSRLLRQKRGLMIPRRAFGLCAAAVLIGPARMFGIRPKDGSPPEAARPGLLGMYFNLPRDLRAPMTPDPAPALVRADRAIDFDWRKEPPAPRLGRSHFAVRWLGAIRIQKAGVYTFRLTHDNGLRVQVAGNLFYDRWSHRAANQMADVKILETGWLPIEVQFHSARSRAPLVRIEWATPGSAAITPISDQCLSHTGRT